MKYEGRGNREQGTEKSKIQSPIIKNSQRRGCDLEVRTNHGSRIAEPAKAQWPNEPNRAQRDGGHTVGMGVAAPGVWVARSHAQLAPDRRVAWASTLARVDDAVGWHG